MTVTAWLIILGVFVLFVGVIGPKIARESFQAGAEQERELTGLKPGEWVDEEGVVWEDVDEEDDVDVDDDESLSVVGAPGRKSV